MNRTIKRLPYLFWHLGFWAVATYLVIEGRGQPIESAFWLGAWAVNLLMLVGQFLLVSMRIRDAGKSQWWVLSIFIPLAWIVWSCIRTRPYVCLGRKEGEYGN